MSNPFNYLKNQRAALVILAVLCIVVAVIDINIKSAPAKMSEQDSLQFANELRAFEESFDSIDAKTHYRRGNRFSHRQEARLFRFNPNTLDSAGFVALGLKPLVAVRIVNYRKAGGVFRTKQDLARINNLRQQDYERLYPYIDLPESIDKNQSDKTLAKESENHEQRQRKGMTATVDINSADSATLVAAGIAPGVAKCLMRERDKFGGFISESQVRDALKWMSDKAKVEEIVSHMRIDPGKVRKINLNNASIDRLKAHPYINYYQAKAIFEHRRTYGRFSSIDDVRKVEDRGITPEFIERIKPYVETK